MKKRKFTLIGIDGGATKVSGWILHHTEKGNVFSLSSAHSELAYSDVPGFITGFEPVPVTEQLLQHQQDMLQLSEQEMRQGSVLCEACARVIIELAVKSKTENLLVGIGMPGLKTEDRRGIRVLANGPRIPDFAAQLEEQVGKAGINLLAGIDHLGSDADYCGIGELYAKGGRFLGMNNAYYLGGGTGAADALLLHGQLLPFDQAKTWLAKTWELKNDLDMSMEKYASSSGIQFLYSRLADVPVDELNLKKIFPEQIASLALKGNSAAVLTFQQVVKYLSLLLLERITTLCAGWQGMFALLNPARAGLTCNHPYLGEVFDRIVMGQRLGELMKSPAGGKIIWTPLLRTLKELISTSSVLPKIIKGHYLTGKILKPKLLICSSLKEAPALGAGIDALLTHVKKIRVGPEL